ncbi:N-terminal nucleophile aminohydrolase [Gigaspora margarita]|uniref:Proteasome subunit beta n=1 Tax=Gigaspora margarita TaxID=4874 RepID=A0A8H4B055_GIGMA|nr:N-terminal nucleophile aminohydrolase [Gigaspora margarita]
MNSVDFYNETLTSVPTERGFYPYEANGGTSLAIAGEDFCVVASDTRQSNGYLINARYAPKAFKMSEKAVLANSGFAADGNALVRRLTQRIQWYKHSHEKEMSTTALAQLVSNTLYSKRFFPFYTQVLLGGIDENGAGVVFSFDPVGSYGLEVCRATGTASALIQPFLDNQVEHKNVQFDDKPRMTLDRAICLAKDAFTSATERDMYTGDHLEIFIIKQDGITIESYPLKKD